MNTRMKRKTLTIRWDQFTILKRAKDDFQKRRGGEANWGDFLEMLGFGYFVGTGLVNLRELERRLQRVEKDLAKGGVEKNAI